MTGERINRAISDANRRARILRLSAEKAFCERLYALARESLSSLRNEAYVELFEVMVRELPPLAWQVVLVHPDDIYLAKKHFPAAEIRPDAGITGGMNVSTQNESIRVNNTFEKRLERAWVDMQPELIRDAYLEVSDEAASAAARGPGISGGVSGDQDKRQTVAHDL